MLLDRFNLLSFPLNMSDAQGLTKLVEGVAGMTLKSSSSQSLIVHTDDDSLAQYVNFKGKSEASAPSAVL